MHRRFFLCSLRLTVWRLGRLFRRVETRRLLSSIGVRRFVTRVTLLNTCGRARSRLSVSVGLFGGCRRCDVLRLCRCRLCRRLVMLLRLCRGGGMVSLLLRTWGRVCLMYLCDLWLLFRIVRLDVRWLTILVMLLRLRFGRGRCVFLIFVWCWCGVIRSW